MKKYEFMFILDVFDEQQTKEEAKEILTRQNANILSEDAWGIRKLAYPIKKRENGYYYLLQVELLPASLKEINSDIRLNEKILKYMATNIKEKKKVEKKSKTKAKKEEMEKQKQQEEQSKKAEKAPVDEKVDTPQEESANVS